MENFKRQYDRLVEENKSLLQEWEESQKESYQVTEYMRNEISEKSTLVTNLETELKTVSVHFHYAVSN